MAPLHVTSDQQLRALTLTPAVLYSNLSTHERLCVGAIAMQGQVAFISISAVAALMGCCYRTAAKTIISLKEKGWLVVTARREANGNRLPSRYEVRPSAGPPPLGTPCLTPPARIAYPLRHRLPISESDQNPRGRIQSKPPTAGWREPDRTGPEALTPEAEAIVRRLAQRMASRVGAART